MSDPAMQSKVRSALAALLPPFTPSGKELGLCDDCAVEALEAARAGDAGGDPTPVAEVYQTSVNSAGHNGGAVPGLPTAVPYKPQSSLGDTARLEPAKVKMVERLSHMVDYSLRLRQESRQLQLRKAPHLDPEFEKIKELQPQVSWFWVPGRIELLGKHTDYCGGPSLLLTVPKGFLFCSLHYVEDLRGRSDESNYVQALGGAALDVEDDPDHASSHDDYAPLRDNEISVQCVGEVAAQGPGNPLPAAAASDPPPWRFGLAPNEDFPRSTLALPSALRGHWAQYFHATWERLKLNFASASAFCGGYAREGEGAGCSGSPCSSSSAQENPSSVRRRTHRIRTEVFFTSDLPPASGMSSSSALVVAAYLVLREADRVFGAAMGAAHKSLQSLMTDAGVSGDALYSYLGCCENGADFSEGCRPLQGTTGVGTFGGSEDHTAILGSRRNYLGHFGFCPCENKGWIPWPSSTRSSSKTSSSSPGLVLVVASSGVIAEKTVDKMADYNDCSFLARGAAQRIASHLELPLPHPTLAALVDRLELGADGHTSLGSDGADAVAKEKVLDRIFGTDTGRWERKGERGNGNGGGAEDADLRLRRAERRRFECLAAEIGVIREAAEIFKSLGDASRGSCVGSAQDAQAQHAQDEGGSTTGGSGTSSASSSKSRDSLLHRLRTLIHISQTTVSDEGLRNLVPETRFLPKKALELGAIASSAFGAGFGGSCYAILQPGLSHSVHDEEDTDRAKAGNTYSGGPFPSKKAVLACRRQAEDAASPQSVWKTPQEFVEQWRREYLEEFKAQDPDLADRALFFVVDEPGGGAEMFFSGGL